MCRSKRSRNDLKLHGDTFHKIRKTHAKDEGQGAHRLATRVGGACPYLVGPLLPLRLGALDNLLEELRGASIVDEDHVLMGTVIEMV